MNTNQANTVVVAPIKSMGIALLLTLLLGPIGMLYVTIWGGILMTILFAIVGFVTFGLGCFILWPICILWTVLATRTYNKRLLQSKGE